MSSNKAADYRCQIDHRSDHKATQPDRDGVDGVQALDGVHGDLRSEAKCTGRFLALRSGAGQAWRLVLREWVNSDGLAVPRRGLRSVVICVGSAANLLIVICRCQDFASIA